ncbi:hypothetical protein EN871_05595 [bacterium M00.F.Ca.ET.228.01.1.1]|uniref:hypothetical protein n=1 Tax=Paraburkholderia phenoliruptrix TaxID=252970 RepID=UPI0010932FEC|nr:hypothetical protein [Paraburkholderia phenoliruptrix]TGP45937.1 hypothetical protein EN871_05595 [bacterium M00.F.Ca.ET.228.01.1.1]TGS04150.1 hypothetical protein EN834_07390 [bacterium M00.F.Ca.ET.191.01.1.1]TGU07230.1 hypothetical protein EN798_09670 [bacterium M00.F.Ca.ET.155.01.1.1]MBW0446465.1 hypothetical protein [Paraburkholderia phenoliruptrix]MBW9097109.1 hypothetical protein [Paraburkholderia phenoliruptrix]
MKHDPRRHQEHRAVILERMAMTRAQLLSANLALRTPHRAIRAGVPAVNVMSSLADTPYVALVLAAGLAAVLLGPRKAIGTLARTSVMAWLTRSARSVFQR